jgi:hypothetical protein
MFPAGQVVGPRGAGVTTGGDFTSLGMGQGRGAQLPRLPPLLAPLPREPVAPQLSEDSEFASELVSC